MSKAFSPRHGAAFILALGLLVLLVLPAQAREWPRPAGPVADYAQVLSPDAKQRISSLATQLWQKSQVAVVVATLPSLEGRPLEETAVDLYRAWGIGQKGVSQGLLILVAVAEKRLRLEVGYGLEGVITDARAGQIRDQVIIPRLRKGDYDEGLLQGVAAVSQAVLSASGQDTSEVPPVEPLTAKGAKSSHQGSWGGGAIFLVLLLAVMLVRGLRYRSQGGGFLQGMLLGLLMSGGGRGGYRSSGGDSGFDSFGGGFGGFGGGMSGGGGASGDFGDSGGDSGGGGDD